MYEIVKIVNGKAIYRMKNSRGCYHVKTGYNREAIFRTIKAATAWIIENK